MFSPEPRKLDQDQIRTLPVPSRPSWLLLGCCRSSFDCLLLQRTLARLQVFLPEVRVSPLSPAAYEIIIQHAADERTRNRDQPARPFLNKLSTRLCRYALNDSWYQPVHHILFEQIAPEIHPGRACRSNPELG